MCSAFSATCCCCQPKATARSSANSAIGEVTSTLFWNAYSKRSRSAWKAAESDASTGTNITTTSGTRSNCSQ